MKRRIFWGGAIISLFLALLLVILIEHTVFNELKKEISFSQDAKILQLAERLNSSDDDISALKNAVADERIILIDKESRLLFDSEAPLKTKEDFFNAPELASAFETGAGRAVRRDSQTNADVYYSAIMLDNGNVLRISKSDALLDNMQGKLILYFIAVYVIIVVISSLSSNYISGKIVKNIEKINLDNPVDTCVYDELLPFAREINTKKNEYLSTIEDIENRRRQIAAIINSMSEGLVVLDENLHIVSLNKSAGAILGVDLNYAEGRPLQAITRQKEIMQLLIDLEKQNNSFVIAHMNSRMYRVAANAVEAGEKGVVFLFTDLTDKLEAESMRRRFTANVSHELRTPLTTISGYAEMLMSGMVKKEDQGVVLERINKESKRMLLLVEDIMRLSKMDEGSISDKYEYIKLMDIVKNCAETLKPVADKKQVELQLSGDGAYIYGDATLVREIVFNLMDNAIKYNKAGGSVKVNVCSRGSESVLTVQDSGIGIEKRHQDKIFERFYRTDKSRSKETGGTGLGLSIVKHAAEYHRAKLHVESEPNKGTKISVVFPVNSKEEKPYNTKKFNAQ